MEIWRNIRGYEGLYQVSNLGRVKSLERIDSNNHPVKEKILKTSVNEDGYLQIGLCKNGRKMFKVHRLVAEAFIPNPNNLPEVNHKDENKQNNCVWNLEFCDHKYNLNYGTRNKRITETKKDVPNIKLSKPVLQYDLDGNFIKEWSSTMEIQRQLGYANPNISACCRGGYFDKKRNKWINVSQAQGFIWRYKNG